MGWVQWEEGCALISLSLSGCFYTHAQEQENKELEMRVVDLPKTKVASDQIRTDMKTTLGCGDLLLSF